MIQKRLKINEIWIGKGKSSARAKDLVEIAKSLNVPVRFKNEEEFSRLLPGVSHQGIVALIDKFTYADLDRVIDSSLGDERPALLVVLDHITDEGNLGALIRTSAYFGVHGLIIPEKRSASVSAGVLKRSSGAYMHVPIVRVVNIERTLGLLKKRDFWIIGAAGDGPESIYRFDWGRDVVLVLGNEQRGLSRLVRERCDGVVSIPGSGHVESLNVAVAGGIILSEIVRQQKRKK